MCTSHLEVSHFFKRLGQTSLYWEKIEIKKKEKIIMELKQTCKANILPNSEIKKEKIIVKLKQTYKADILPNSEHEWKEQEWKVKKKGK